MSLAPCPSCSRHVASDALRCPFCDGEVAPAAKRLEPSGRLSRAAIMAFGATLAASVAACGDKGSSGAKTPDPTSDSDAGPQQIERRHPGGGGDGNQAMPYGAPPANGVVKRVV